MYYLLDKKSDETLTINFIGTEQFKAGDKLILDVTEPIKGITDITSYTDTTIGETDKVYLKKFFQYKIGVNGKYSDSLPIEQLTTLDVLKNLCPRKNFYLRLLYFRVDDGGNNNSVTITLSNVSVGGDFEYTISDENVYLTSGDTTQIFEISDVLKIYSIDSFEVVSTSKNDTFDIQYRFSQDNKRTWSTWEKLTLPNIKTAKIDKLRFVNLQYLFKLKNGSNNVRIYDVILYGEIQNVSADSLKINKIGFKENCINLYNKSASPTEQTSGINDNLPTSVKDSTSTTQSLLKITSDYQLHMNFLTQGLACYNSPNNVGGDSTTQLSNLSSQNSQNSNTFWNPYEINKTTNWYNFLANTINSMFGFVVDYHRTDPDVNGIDKVIFEYQLYNIVDMKQLKVLIPENNFPDNQVIINQFNLDLFDTFKINILKDEFKNAFGVQFRPGKEDIIYFCQTNRMYIVKHAQVHKDVMNGGIYYDVILEKYEKRANVINRIEESKQKIDELTLNTTIDDLFGFDIDKNQKQIANKEQLKPKSFDYTRFKINENILYNNLQLYNGNTKVLESCYSMENVKPNEDAIVYNGNDNILLESDNRSFIFWFNFPNEYSSDSGITKKVINSYNVPNVTIYNLIDNTSTDNLGYKIWYQNEKIWFMINNKFYTLPISLKTNIWHALIINFDQRQGNITFKLYRRNTKINVLLINPKTYDSLTLDLDTDFIDIEYEINNNGFKPVNNIEIESDDIDSKFILMDSNNILINETYKYTINEKLHIKGSNMKLSNIRIMDNIIKDGDEQFFLNELIIKDAQSIILVDNAEKQIKTINYTNKNWR